MTTGRKGTASASPFVGVVSLVALAAAGCPPSTTTGESSGSASASTSASSSVAPAYAPPEREGCVRSGSLEAIASDPSCVVARADDSVTRDAMKQMVIELEPDAPVVVAGGTILVRLALTNRGATEADLVFEAQPVGSTPRPDWTRLAGVPDLQAHPSPPEGFHVVMPIRTLDAQNHSVDGLPTTPVGATPAVRLLRVRLRPGAKLTQTFAWWAMRIPAPMPIYRDDAGHRIVPKTAPMSLPPGPYTVDVDLPLHGVSPAERLASTHIRVEKADTKRPAAAPP